MLHSCEMFLLQLVSLIAVLIKMSNIHGEPELVWNAMETVFSMEVSAVSCAVSCEL